MAKEIVAMILAGGRGSRLYALTQKTAKPAVSFGGKYRIVDFPLSNCVNSRIDTVGIATQYQPQKLNEYIGNGQPWDLDRLYGGVHTLPPYEQAKGTDWYKGHRKRYLPEHQLYRDLQPEVCHHPVGRPDLQAGLCRLPALPQGEGRRFLGGRHGSGLDGKLPASA